MAMSETLRDVAVDLAGQLASCEANAAYDGLDAWEHRSEYFGEYMDRINAADAERTCRIEEVRRTDAPKVGPPLMRCSACGTESPWLSKEDRFCRFCGARVVR